MAQSQQHVASVRQRAKMACEPCRSRKRRCNGDGHHPCDSCLQWEYECYYAPDSRKRKRLAWEETHSDSPLHVSTEDRASPSAASASPLQQARNDRSMEANSGVVFPHLLGVKLNASHAPKIHGFSWNLGLRPSRSRVTTSVCSIITKDECTKLASVYFEMVHPLYGFLDKVQFNQSAVLRWNDPQTVVSGLDTIICGVTALGHLFSQSQNKPQEEKLVQCARSLLEETMDDWRPNLRFAAGWLLRTIYLRATSSPHAVWMASSTLMHVLEAAGGHQEPEQASVMFSEIVETPVTGELQRRLFWIATSLNTWISQEFGRSRVSLQGVSCRLPTPVKGDFTTGIFDLYHVSFRLNPEYATEAAELEDKLQRVGQFHFTYDPLVLSQSQLALVIYRRLRIAMACIPDESSARMIRLGNLGLDAAERLATKHCPWWHVLNVPFQLLCVLLAMDTREALSQVSRARDVLNTVNTKFSTAATQKALETADLLISLTKQKKQQDITLLDTATTAQSITGDQTSNHATQEIPEVQSTTDLPANNFSFTAADFDRFDWNIFLETSVPFPSTSYAQT